jgi:hypothetical protein
VNGRLAGQVTAAVAAAGLAAACAHPQPVRSPRVPVELLRKITLYDRPLDVHLARPAQLQPGTPLLLYATGDGGWRGKDAETYRRMIRWGYPVAGFSAPGYLKNLGFVSGTTTPGRLARDYQQLIEFSKATLSLPSATRTILVGVSRGAGLAVVAAGRPEMNAELAGVLAVALTKEEEYVRHYTVRPGLTASDMPTRELVEFETYEYLDRLQKLPLVVIQSTSDNYLPAEAARRLFGPDTETRKFYAVTARDHSFSDAREALFERMASALAWMSRVPQASSAPISSSPKVHP